MQNGLLAVVIFGTAGAAAAQAVDGAATTGGASILCCDSFGQCEPMSSMLECEQWAIGAGHYEEAPAVSVAEVNAEQWNYNSTCLGEMLPIQHDPTAFLVEVGDCIPAMSSSDGTIYSCILLSSAGCEQSSEISVEWPVVSTTADASTAPPQDGSWFFVHIDTDGVVQASGPGVDPCAK